MVNKRLTSGERKEILISAGEKITISEDEGFKMFEKVLHKITHEYKGEIEYEDAFQIVSEGYIEAFRTYDINKGSKFSSYLYRVASMKVLGEVRSLCQKRTPKGNRITECHIDSIEELENDIYQTPEKAKQSYEDYIANIERTIVVKDMLFTLPEEDRYILAAVYFDGKTQKTVAQELGYTQPVICAKIQKALKTLRRDFLLQSEKYLV